MSGGVGGGGGWVSGFELAAPLGKTAAGPGRATPSGWRLSTRPTAVCDHQLPSLDHVPSTVCGAFIICQS